MPPPDAPRLMPSLLDRLTDPATAGPGGRPAAYDPRQMLEAVRADLEELLNTRRTADIPPAFANLRASIEAYGLPDMHGLGGGTADANRRLARAVEAVVAAFEPRLRDVRVTALADAADARSVRFHVDAKLNVDPAPDVGFETVLELTTGRATVKTAGGRA